MCHNIPYANCDVVVDAFEHATKRIIGSKYLRGGMGDGGECHPRDNRALDYLCNKLGISSNIFKFIMEARELQAGWLAYLLVNAKLPAVILGKRFKSNSNLTTDSASILVNTIATALGVETHYHDPMLNLEYYPSEPHVFLAAINEPWVANYPYPSGSTVLDVWRQFDKADIEMLKVRGVKYVPVGRSVGDEG
jgi:UDPglucose 6-dehydrogenase